MHEPLEKLKLIKNKVNDIIVNKQLTFAPEISENQILTLLALPDSIKSGTIKSTVLGSKHSRSLQV